MADEFQVDPVVDLFGQVPFNLLFDATASSDECRLFCVLTTYDLRQTGECFPSQETLGKRLGWSHAKTKRVLRELGNRGAIETVRRRREPATYRLLARLIPPNQDGSSVSHQEVLMAQNGNQDGSSVENVPLTKERTNERARAARIPIPFFVDEAMYDWARRECPSVNVDRETEKFVDFWRAKGNNATKTDWTATWRNWMRKAAEGWK